MDEDSANVLLDAVDALTIERRVETLITDDETGEELRAHSEFHAPLLALLVNGTGITRSQGGSAEIKLPIDADALELAAQVYDLMRLWCRKLGATFDGTDVETVMLSIRRWYLAHVNAVRSGKVSEETNTDVTRMVQGWVRMIEAKFAPDEKREWTEACPAFVIVPVSADTKAEAAGVPVPITRCGAKRITVNGVERFAISLNVTQKVAECHVCGTKWEGLDGLKELRYQTNVVELGEEV